MLNGVVFAAGKLMHDSFLLPVFLFTVCDIQASNQHSIRRVSTPKD